MPAAPRSCESEVVPYADRELGDIVAGRKGGTFAVLFNVAALPLISFAYTANSAVRLENEYSVPTAIMLALRPSVPQDTPPASEQVPLEELEYCTKVRHWLPQRCSQATFQRVFL